MKSNSFLWVMAGLLLLCLFSSVVSASTRTVINPGATVFIGEQGLDITSAMGSYNRIAWWASSSTPGIQMPTKTIDLTGRITYFTVAPSDFVAYTGNWYLYDGTNPLNPPLAFIVADPYLDSYIYSQTADVSGTSVPRGELLTFHIRTNMYTIAINRGNKAGDVDQNVNIKVRDPVGTVYTALYEPGNIPHPLQGQFVNTLPWYWGGVTWWNTGAQLTFGNYYYQDGAYTVWAESTLNWMKDNYKYGGVDYTGKTVSFPKQVTLVPAGPVTPAPTVTSIDPNTGVNTGTVQISNLQGTGFVSLGSVKLTKAGYGDIEATGVATYSSTHIGCYFPITYAQIGSWNVVVTNPDGQSGMLPLGFTVTAPPPAPVAAFSGSPTSGVASLPVTFTDESTGTPTGWAWFFGDEPWTAPWTQVTTGTPIWSARYDHTAVAMPDGSIILMGGLDSGGVLLNDVWRSTDLGASWTQVIPGTPIWSPRSDYASVVTPDGSIVVMGGVDLTNDVWMSPDNGATWTQQKPNDANYWKGRESHSSVALPDGSIVLMGGWDGSKAHNDTWRSTDKGITWHLQNASSGWGNRSDSRVVAMPDGSIVLMGGGKNDVWRSEDKGETWTLMTEHAGWAQRPQFGAVAMPDGSIIMMGGAWANDVWRSTDNGATWKKIKPNDANGWSARHLFSAVAMPDGSIVLMGGRELSNTKMNDVWRFQPVGPSERNPSHTYTTPGTYQVALQAYNAIGYSSTRKTGYITVTGPAPTVISIDPNTGLNTGSVTITNLGGTGFVNGATVKLTKAGTDIIATNVVWVSATKLTCDLPLARAPTGVWDVVVTNPDTQAGTLTNGFTVGFIGPKIAFASNRDGNYEIYTMNADGSNVVRLTNDAAHDDEPAWSPDGTKIAFTSSRDGNPEIYVMDADGSSQTRLTNSGFEDMEPAWSPDGTKIAFASNRDGYYEIYTMNADGSSQTRLTNSDFEDMEPAWSPDGTKIAFTSTRDGNYEIYVMNADGSSQTRITNNAPNEDLHASWSPHGTKIAFASNRDGNYEIYTMNADGSSQTRLTNSGFEDWEPAWSPDGTKIAFMSNRDELYEIYVMNADGTDPIRLTNDIAYDGSPAWWSPPPPSPIQITTCPYVISDPGVYELQNDCTNSPYASDWWAIEIRSSDVVFDGMGHTIDGINPNPVSSGVKGVYSYAYDGPSGSPYTNIIVKNVIVNGTNNAISYNYVNNGRIENVKATNNLETGIFLYNSSYNTVTGCTAENTNDLGIGLWLRSDSNTITDNIATNNYRGFAIDDSKNNIVTDNAFTNNNYGVELYTSDLPTPDPMKTSDNEIKRNNIRGNTKFGIQIVKSGPNSIYDNYFSNNANTNFVGTPSPNTWNMPPGTPGPNIIGGSSLGGNYWADPAGTGFSQTSLTCPDIDGNGFCDGLYPIEAGNYDNLPLKTLTTPADAADFVKTKYDLTGKVLYFSPELVLANSKVHTWGYKSTHEMPATAGYLTFIDDNPEANWEHPARLIHVEDKIVKPATTEYNVWSPPNDVDLSLSSNGGVPSNPGGDTLTPPPGAPVCTPDCGHYYAVLLSGGVQKEANYARYRNDIAFMYQTLTQKYGYPKDHITVLMSDGTNPEYDQLASYTDNTPNYANSITDFDGDGIPEVKDGAVTRTNVLNTLAELRSTLTTEDNLFIFTTNHGGTTTTDPASKDVILYLWGTDAEGWITDADFVNALPGSPQYPLTGVKSITMVMEQCFGGGFIDNFIDTSGWNTENRVISTAADFNEYSWGNAYSFQWISGEWFDRFSMENAHINAHDNDRYHMQFEPPLENPQFSSTSGAGTTQYLADCLAAPPSITVEEPKAYTWYTGQKHDIIWTQTGLSGKKVNIELWKGTATTKTLDIVPPSTVDATTGTQEWTIPATLTAARDYYIKIYQSDAPEVFGRSTGALTIIRSSGTGTGKLWVNSTPVPNLNEPGALIYIGGVLQKHPVTGVNNLTNSSVWLQSGTRFVGVDRTGYYPVPVSQVTVPQGGTLVLKFQLQPIITDQPNNLKNDCVPYGTMEIRSTPEQDAKITILDQDTGNKITGLYTDTTTKIAPGTYTVTVEHDGYLTATQTDVIIKKPDCPTGEERDVSVDFDLEPTKDVHAIVKIVPRTLNLKSNGYFMAFVTLPSGYKAADVIPGSVMCEGATALKLIRHKLFPRTFVAIFPRSDLVDVPTGNSVPMTVEGSIKQTNGNPGFSGTDKIKVISTKGNKEDVDDWGKMTDEKVFSQFNPGYSKDDEKVFSQSNQKDDKDNGKGSSQSNQRNDNKNVKVYYNGRSR